MENKSSILQPKPAKDFFRATRQISSGPGIFFFFEHLFCWWNHLHFHKTILWSHSATRIDPCVQESLAPYAINTHISRYQTFLLWPYLPKPQLPIGPTDIMAGFHFWVGFFGFCCCYFKTHSLLPSSQKIKRYKASQTLTCQNPASFHCLSQKKTVIVVFFFKYDLLVLSFLCCFSGSF